MSKNSELNGPYIKFRNYNILFCTPSTNQFGAQTHGWLCTGKIFLLSISKNPCTPCSNSEVKQLSGSTLRCSFRCKTIVLSYQLYEQTSSSGRLAWCLIAQIDSWCRTHWRCNWIVFWLVDYARHPGSSDWAFSSEKRSPHQWLNLGHKVNIQMIR